MIEAVDFSWGRQVSELAALIGFVEVVALGEPSQRASLSCCGGKPFGPRSDG